MIFKDFISKNNISIFVQGNLDENKFYINKTSLELENISLFEQIILNSEPKYLDECIEGQILPQMWSQGNSKCIISKPKGNLLIIVFYNTTLNAIENYDFANKLDLQIKEILN